jgi:hypothetical protein
VPINVESITATPPRWPCHQRWACDKHLRHAVHLLAEKSLTQCAWAEIYYRRHREKGRSHAVALRRLGQRWLKIIHRMWMDRNLTTPCCTTKISSDTALGYCNSKRSNYNLTY